MPSENEVWDLFGNEERSPDSLETTGAAQSHNAGSGVDNFLKILAGAASVVRPFVNNKQDYGQLGDPRYRSTQPAAVTGFSIQGKQWLLYAGAVVLTVLLVVLVGRRSN